jgi:hypothetical protein
MPSVCDFNTGGDVAGHALRELDSLIRGVLAASMDALAQEDEQQAKKRAEALRAFALMSSTLSPRPCRRSTTKFASGCPYGQTDTSRRAQAYDGSWHSPIVRPK